MSFFPCLVTNHQPSLHATGSRVLHRRLLECTKHLLSSGSLCSQRVLDHVSHLLRRPREQEHRPRPSASSPVLRPWWLFGSPQPDDRSPSQQRFGPGERVEMAEMVTSTVTNPTRRRLRKSAVGVGSGRGTRTPLTGVGWRPSTGLEAGVEPFGAGTDPQHLGIKKCSQAAGSNTWAVVLALETHKELVYPPTHQSWGSSELSASARKKKSGLRFGRQTSTTCSTKGRRDVPRNVAHVASCLHAAYDMFQ